jgi:hypothetical protein
MATCYKCGESAEVFICGIPICEKCEEEREAGKPAGLRLQRITAPNSLIHEIVEKVPSPPGNRLEPAKTIEANRSRSR